MPDKKTLLKQYKYDKSMPIVRVMMEEAEISAKEAIRVLREFDYDRDHPKKKKKKKRVA